MSGQTWDNAGTGGASLDATLGSSASADSNDPLFLAHPGDNGGNYIYLPFVSGTPSAHPNIPDEAAFDITGDIDLRAYVALDDWSPASAIILLSKYAGAGTRSYYLQITSNARVSIVWSADGTAVNTRSSTVAPTIADGAGLWVRATLDVDNGAAGHDAIFYTSNDGETWTQLGTTVTTAGTTSIFASNTDVYLGIAASGGGSNAGKYYRAQIFNGIAGTKVLDVDTSVITSGSQTSFTALTGQTVTFNRNTSGRKPVGVVSPLWLFGTDDYIEVADNSLIDFAGSDSFSIVSVCRQWATFGTNDALIAKKADTTNTTQGYYLGSGASTAAQTQAQIGDGTNGLTINSSTAVGAGTLRVHSFVRNTQTDTAQLYLDKVQVASATDNTTGSLANSEAFRIGRLSGAGTEYNAMELFAVAVFNRALTQPEIDSIVDYYQGKIPG